MWPFHTHKYVVKTCELDQMNTHYIPTGYVVEATSWLLTYKLSCKTCSKYLIKQEKYPTYTIARSVVEELKVKYEREGGCFGGSS